MTDGRWEAIASQLTELRLRESRCAPGETQARLEIAERRHQLREAARALTASDAGNEALAARLAVVEDEIGRAIGNRVPGSFAGAGSGMGGGIDPDVLHDLNRRIDQSSDLVRLREEAAVLRRLLAEALPEA